MKLADTLLAGGDRFLRRSIAAGKFPGLRFEDAMKFLLTNGIVPRSDLPVSSLVDLEDWARSRLTGSQTVVRLTATELKNRTGSVLDAVARGDHVIITKHGRPFCEITRIAERQTAVDG